MNKEWSLCAKVNNINVNKDTGERLCSSHGEKKREIMLVEVFSFVFTVFLMSCLPG